MPAGRCALPDRRRLRPSEARLLSGDDRNSPLGTRARSPIALKLRFGVFQGLAIDAEGQRPPTTFDIGSAPYRKPMELPVSPERLAQLEDFARRRGKDTAAAALDEALAEYLDSECQDYQEAVEGIRRGLEDVKAGRTEPADTFLDAFARKHGLPS